jgi:hypothetical protein
LNFIHWLDADREGVTVTGSTTNNEQRTTDNVAYYQLSVACIAASVLTLPPHASKSAEEA